MRHVTVTPDEIKPDSKWSLWQGIDIIGVVERFDWPDGHKLAATPYVLWTPSPSTRAGRMSWFATFGEAKVAADKVAEERARNSTRPPREVHRETYRDVEFTITHVPAWGGDGGDSHFAHYRVAYNETRPEFLSEFLKGDVEDAVAAIRGRIDLEHANREILPKLVALINARPNDQGTSGPAPKVGDVAFVPARGRYRAGLVTEVTEPQATVAYTTPTDPTRVYTKAVRFDDLAAG